MAKRMTKFREMASGKHSTIFDEEVEKVRKRDVANEKHHVQTGTSEAKSSKQCLFYHDIPPEFYRRVAERHTVGHKRYNDDPVPITMNLNWRIGLDDPLYVMDRLNHMFEHMVSLIESGNAKDDNLGAIGWCVCFLMECERLHPDVFRKVICQCDYSGQDAKEQQDTLREQQRLRNFNNDTRTDK